MKRLGSANNWFSPNQHGFRSGFSTETATLSLTSLIENNRKNKVITCCAFLDIKSAFDAAWHPAILNCLISKNCPAFLVKLLANFLNSRSCILSSPLASKVTVTELGCPQGSVLSPFLWNILLEDLLCHNFPFPFRFIAYADDIVVCTMHKDYNLAHAHLQIICDAVVAWGLSVKLVFNGAKSFFLVFSPKRNIPPLTLAVDNIIVPRSSSCMYLGLKIDDKLSWNLHISNKCITDKKMLFLILKCCRLTWGLSRSTISLLYKSSVIPKFQFQVKDNGILEYIIPLSFTIALFGLQQLEINELLLPLKLHNVFCTSRRSAVQVYLYGCGSRPCKHTPLTP